MTAAYETPQVVVISLMGPPGSGKGTFSLFFIRAMGWTHIAPGNLCRKYSTEDSHLGKSIDFALKSGKMVSNTIITSMVKECLVREHKDGSGFICDGYPRTREQAESFYQILRDFAELNSSFYVFRFLIDRDIIIKRLMSRLICSNKECQAVYSACLNSQKSSYDGVHCTLCRSCLERRCDDSNRNVIDERLATYYAHESDLLSFYKGHGIPVYDLNGEEAISYNCDYVKDVVGVSVL